MIMLKQNILSAKIIFEIKAVLSQEFFKLYYIAQLTDQDFFATNGLSSKGIFGGYIWN